MNFKDLVQSLLVYVGIPAVTLYPLGFAALAIQLWNDPLFPYYDFATIWYAVTLVPKTVVVGTGAHTPLPQHRGPQYGRRLDGLAFPAPKARA
jgi:hypothetical protein